MNEFLICFPYDVRQLCRNRMRQQHIVATNIDPDKTFLNICFQFIWLHFITAESINANISLQVVDVWKFFCISPIFVLFPDWYELEFSYFTVDKWWMKFADLRYSLAAALPPGWKSYIFLLEFFWTEFCRSFIIVFNTFNMFILPFLRCEFYQLCYHQYQNQKNLTYNLMGFVL